MNQDSSNTNLKVAIIGSGPAGLTAAIYTARAGLEPVVLAGIEYGGLLMTTTDVENYPGFPDGIEGPQLIQNMIKQAERFGAVFKYEYVENVSMKDRPFILKTNKVEYQASSIVIATGSSPRRLGLESENRYWGKGVSACATCDGALFKGKRVAVIGGGDSAMEEALFLTRHAAKVYVIHRRDELRASKIMQDRVLSNSKIEVVLNSTVKEVVGEQLVTGLRLENTETNDESDLKVDGMFLAIGHKPQTGFLREEILLTDQGYVQTDDGVHTSVDGVFVAGDVQDDVYQQAITAAGAGCKAALELQKYLEKVTD